MTLISVILPVYNVEKYLAKCIESLEIQINNSNPFEVIFIDDGSTDQSLELLKIIEKRYSFIKIYNHENKGVGYTRNSGISYAKGEYIYFMDPDDYLNPEFICSMYKIIQENNNPEMILFGYNEVLNGRIVKSHTVPNNLYLKNHEEIISYFSELVSYNNIYSPWNKLYKKQFLIDNNLEFTFQKTGQDSLFNIEVWKNLETLSVSSQIFYNYVLFRNDSAQTKVNWKKIFDDIKILDSFKLMIDEFELEDVLYFDLCIDKIFKNLKLYSKSSKGKIYGIRKFFSIPEVISKIEYIKENNYKTNKTMVGKKLFIILLFVLCEK